MFRYEVGALTRVFRGDFGRKKVVDGWGCSRLICEIWTIIAAELKRKGRVEERGFAGFGGREVLEFGVG